MRKENDVRDQVIANENKKSSILNLNKNMVSLKKIEIGEEIFKVTNKSDEKKMQQLYTSWVGKK